MTPLNRRTFLKGAAAGAAVLAYSNDGWSAPDDLESIRTEIQKRHEESGRRLQQWIHQESIAAENRGVSEGCDLTMQLLREAGFQTVSRVATDGQPGIFATLDAGAPRSLGLYFMYDVKGMDPREWSSPPWEAALVDKPGLGKVVVGRGAVNQKGPQATVLAALHAIRGAGPKLPVNLVLVAEGEEEIGSPHFPGRRSRPPWLVARGFSCLRPVRTWTAPSRSVLGPKEWSSWNWFAAGEKWGRGPRQDIHSSNKARVDSPAWHLVQALNTLVLADGNAPAIDGFADKARPIDAKEKAMVAEGARRMDEAQTKKLLGVDHWIGDANWTEALERLVSQPTVNIEGLVGGYTGSGGKTILPHRAVAKLDLRLVPDMTAQEALSALKSHLAKRGYGDIEVNMTGGYNPTSTPEKSALIQAQIAVYRRHQIEPILWPRNAGSWPGYVFTSPPLSLPAGHFGLGHGSGAHAPDEYYVIDSTNPKIEGFEGAAFSFVEYLYELAAR